ncbi:Alpha/Beta hydrolase protein [Fennellomyces sp. T-0311]|nr:Alpha/Beta hydrolase protein [Fennellomyces sp. T-0311]
MLLSRLPYRYPGYAAKRRSLATWATATMIVAGVPAGLYLYKCVMLVLFQSKLIYLGYIPPGSRNEPFTPDKAISGLNVNEQTVVTPDRKQLKGFAVERTDVKNDQRRPVIVYFQGNAGNMIHRFDLFDTILKAVPTATVVGVCYRGFGSSSGRASERGLEQDARSIMHHVNDVYPGRPVYLYGHSLGGAVAIGLLADNRWDAVQGLVVENTYTSIKDMVRALYPRYTPYPFIAKYFLWNHWPSLDRIRRIQAPILFLSSEKDEIVPSEHMERLYDAAISSKQRTWVQFPRSTHMDMNRVESRLYRSALSEFIK